MSFDVKQYVLLTLGAPNSVRVLSTAFDRGFCGCCGSNNGALDGEGLHYNKGITLTGTPKARLPLQINPVSGGEYRWPDVEHYEADLTELVGQPLRYQVVIQKGTAPHYKHNYEQHYEKAKG